MINKDQAVSPSYGMASPLSCQQVTVFLFPSLPLGRGLAYWRESGGGGGGAKSYGGKKV